MSAAFALLALAVAPPTDDGSRLGASDLPAYLDALRPSNGPASPVGFRDLWDHPERHRGRLVRVEGRVVRRFAQPAVGAFPALTEVWLRTPGDNPICLVYPTPPRDDLRAGAPVAFAGTFLRRLRYDGGDGPRLAPLVVGGSPPEPSRSRTAPTGPPAWAFWAGGVAAAAALAAVMAWVHLRRPGPPPLARRPGGRADPLVFLQDHPTHPGDGPVPE